MVSIGHVVPVKKRIEIEIPADYINKEIEILILPIEKPEKSKKNSLLELSGTWEDDRPVEEIIKEIYDCRTSNREDIVL